MMNDAVQLVQPDTYPSESTHSRWRALDWPAAAAFLLPFLLYLFTLAPTVYNLDSAELTTAAATGGIVRATGYPLYLLLGRFWALLPVGDVGYRLNLFSAFCGAATIFFTAHILRRLQVGRWAQLGALGLLATAPYFWAMSLIAEVYTLHTALMSAIILALLRWEETATARGLALPVFLIAVSMGNHAATALLLPAATWFVLSRAPRLFAQPRTWAILVTSGLAGAAIFLYLPILYSRGPAFNYAGHFNSAGQFVPVNLHTLSGLFWLVSGRAFAGQMFGYAPADIAAEFAHFAQQLWQAFFAIGLGPGLLGALALLQRRRRVGVLLLLMFLANVLFYVNYRVVDKNTMFLPAYLVWALWAGAGLETILHWLRRQGSGRGRTPLLLARVLILLAVCAAAVWNWQRVDLSDDWSTRRQSEEILATVETDAIIFGWWETVPGVQYLQFVEGQRPDVTAINRFLISGADMEALILREVEQRPIYINTPPVQLLQRLEISRSGPLYRLHPTLADDS